MPPYRTITSNEEPKEKEKLGVNPDILPLLKLPLLSNHYQLLDINFKLIS
jgi:hypothetical protein